MGPPTFTDGAALRIALDDDPVPDIPPGTLPLHPPFGPVESPPESDADSGRRTPKRSGEDLGALLPRMVRTESQEVREVGVQAFRDRRPLMTSETSGARMVHDDDVQHAVRFPLEGRPAYGRLDRRLDHHISD